MRSKKTYIVLIGILLAFCLVMFLTFGVDNLIKEKYDTTIVLGEDTVWTLKKRKWYYMDNYDELNWNKYDVYFNNEKVGNKYYLWHSDKWYVFDSKKNAVKVDGDLLAVNSNYDVKVHDFNISDIEDYTYVNSVLNDNEISDNQFTVDYRIVFDYDNDGEDEEFYVISNTFPMDFDPNKIFSFVFMIDNEKIYPIFYDTDDNTGFNGCRPYFNTFIDVDNDSKYEFILSCSKYSTTSVGHGLYKLKNGEFKILISNNN